MKYLELLLTYDEALANGGGIEVLLGSYKGLVYGVIFSCGRRLDFSEGRKAAKGGIIKFQVEES